MLTDTFNFIVIILIGIFVTVVGFGDALFAQTTSGQSSVISIPAEDIRLGTAEEPVLEAVKLREGETIRLDGRLDEEAWLRTPVATGFTQRVPDDGESATQKTEVRILYSGQAIYVGFVAYDSAPDSILAPLFRRDGNQPSDWVYVSLDSYNDNRTAFTFAVNPRGVQKDVLYYDDRNEDILWDAVWQAETQIYENGWTAEIRIPLSQLRYSSSNGQHVWGVNFQRRIARNGEISFWAPSSQRTNRMVSNFGTLNGIGDLDTPMRLEIIPYAAASNLRAPDPGDSNPFYRSNQLDGTIGGDIRYGISSDLTLTATINPDFGQVEADPAVINLTAHETFFEERRPFFLEGNEIFQFGRTQTYNMFGNTRPFYSRRIGRTPQGSPGRAGVEAEHVDNPDYTRIATAVKLSGKTQSGWSVGILDAFTLEEDARLITPGGTEQDLAVEPAANYLVSRIKKDFNSGNSYLGGFGSAVNRRIDDTYFEDFLRSSAYLAGADFEHNFGNGNWVTSGYVTVSSINGSPSAIERAQVSPVRYFNRIDSDRLSVDPDATSLTGYATEMSLQKRGGDDRWLGSLTYAESSPGYETNDLGFQTRTNYRTISSALIYRNPSPQRLRYYDMFVAHIHGWNFDRDTIIQFYGLGGNINFRNQWRVNFMSNYFAPRMDDRLTRGGPLMEQPSSLNLNMNINTNPNRTVSLNVGTYQETNADGGYNHNFWSGITAQPTTWLQLRVSPQVNFNKNTLQYITTAEDPTASATYGHRYLFADVEQTTVFSTFRVDWTFSTTMSLQTYVRPFISTGTFSNFKELAEPGTYNFNRYGDDVGEIQKSDGQYIVDPTGTGDTAIRFRDPDFNFRSVQGNAVFRWEYRPGSSLYLVWQQQREHAADAGSFDFNRELSALFRSESTNVFMVKASFWFGN